MNIRSGLVLVVIGLTTIASAALPIDQDKQLRADYLACETRAGDDDAEHCSGLYERVLKDSFGGDFNAFLAFQQAAKRERLKAEYAACEKTAGAGDAEHCAGIYEKLLKEGFGGDFKAFMTFWEGNKRAQLRAEYLVCEKDASTLGIPAGHCSEISEKVLQEQFGGDINALMAWIETTK